MDLRSGLIDVTHPLLRSAIVYDLPPPVDGRNCTAKRC
jgi:hypothetical protein